MATNILTQVPKLSDLTAYDVNRADQYEGVKKAYYDFQTYAQVGQTSLNFFQVPVGQSSKTLADTNMQQAGSLPSPIQFLVQDIQIFFFPAGDLSQFGAQAAAENVNDVYDVSKSGWLEFLIGSKNYIQEGPIGRFPPSNGLTVAAALADQTTAGATMQSRISYANMAGRIWAVTPQILLKPTQNFKVSLNWPAAVAISAAGRIGVVMNGIEYRLSQ